MWHQYASSSTIYATTLDREQGEMKWLLP